MTRAAKQETDQLKKQREELSQELDKGIHDMEREEIVPCDEGVRQVRRKYGLMDI
ncbi:MAG: hypothetical protein ACI4TK_06920 [Agathobacter sp.]